MHPAAVAVTVTGSQTYGGSPTFTTSQSLPAGISLSGSVTCATVNSGTSITPTLAAGVAYTIDGASCSGLSLSGTGSSNYVIAYTGGTFTVHPAPVAVTVSGSQTYGGSPTFTTSQSLPAGISLSGSVACATVNSGTSITPTLAAGVAYTIDGASCSGLSLSGTNAGDYVLSLTGGTFTVHPAPVAVTVTGSQTYGGSPTFTTSQSLPAGISLSGSVACATVNSGTSITPTLAAGVAYTIDGASCSGLSLSGTNAGDYVLSLTGGTFTVHPAPVAVTVTGSQTYGGSPTFTTSQSLPAGISLSGSVACATVNSGTSITPTLAAGVAYTIDGASCSGLSLSGTGSSNYVIAYTGGTFTVTKATPKITWAPPASIVYGTAVSGTQLDASATASVGGHTVSVAGTFAYNPAAGAVLHAGPQILGTTFTPSDGVDFTTATATVPLTVTPAPLTITAGNASRFFGQPNPAFTVSYHGFVNNDSPAALHGTLTVNTAATAASPPDSYAIVASGLSSPDYTITYLNGTLTVTKAPTTTTVTVTPAQPTLGGLVTFTATVAPAQVNDSGVHPTGTVAFFVDGAANPAATMNLAAGGTAVFHATLPGGTTTVSAAYNGDGNFLASSTTAPTKATIRCAATITGTHSGAVIAAKGLTCIEDAHQTGSVTVAAGASLDVENSTLTGAIVANGAKSIRICATAIGSLGSITISGSTGFVLVGDPGEDGCAANMIGGSLNLNNNTGGLVAVDNTIAGALNAAGNRGAGPFPDQTAPDISGNHH